MIAQSVHYTFAPEDAGKVAQMLAELAQLSRNEPGVLNFIVARDNQNPAAFALWEEYADADAIDAHRETEHFARLVLNGIRKLAKDRSAVTGSSVD